ncbi:hypothetical protein ACHAO7_004887 [Fusarium culmorum]|uniref:Uncharacterized protein n=1 Tax=Fusarium culmorum TaxID=5516 RepID=A0A2T4GCJ0_FUSCU|nr:hypothetical protein FCULG_00010594 [Fusarium culmorum]
MSRVPISQSYASGDCYDQFYFYEDLAPSRKSYSEYYTGGQEVEPVFYENKTPRNLSYSHYNADGQGNDQSSFYQDLNPSYSSYSEYSVYGQEVESVSCEATTSYTSPYSDYYATGQGYDQSRFCEDSGPSYSSYSEYNAYGKEVETVFREVTAQKMTPYFDDDGVGLGIMVPDYSEYYDNSPTPTSETQSEVVPPALSLANPHSNSAVKSIWFGNESRLGSLYYSPESEETVTAATMNYSVNNSSTGTSTLRPPAPDLRYLDEDDSTSSLFNLDEGWEEQLIDSYAAEVEECTFLPRDSFFSNVAYSTLPPSSESVFRRNTDAMPRSEAFSPSRFRDEYLSLWVYYGDMTSVTSGTVTLQHVAEVAQVAEIAHINDDDDDEELTRRDSGGSFTRKCLEKLASPQTYSKLFKRAEQKLVSRSKKRLQKVGNRRR